MLLDQGQKGGKKFGPFLDLCVSSLRRGHANLLCIVPILSDVPEGTRSGASSSYINALSLLFLCNVGLVEGSLVKFGALWACGLVGFLWRH